MCWASGASLQRANTQLAALAQDVKQLQRQQPTPAQKMWQSLTQPWVSRRPAGGSPGVADDAYRSTVPECAHNLLLHKCPEGGENEQSLMQLVAGAVHDDLGLKRVNPILSATNINLSRHWACAAC